MCLLANRVVDVCSLLTKVQWYREIPAEILRLLAKCWCPCALLCSWGCWRLLIIAFWEHWHELKFGVASLLTSCDQSHGIPRSLTRFDVPSLLECYIRDSEFVDTMPSITWDPEIFNTFWYTELAWMWYIKILRLLTPCDHWSHVSDGIRELVKAVYVLTPRELTPRDW